MKLLIVIDNFNTGGIATSLYSFLKNLPAYVECDILSFDLDAIDNTRIPSNVKILEPDKKLELLGKSLHELKKKSFFIAVKKFFLVAISKIVSGEFARRIVFRSSKTIGNYDMALSYAHDNGWHSISKGCNDYVAKYVDANIKVAYIHCDYSNFGGYDKRQERTLRLFTHIATVSKSCKESFIKMFPNLANKIVVLENFTDTVLIREKSLEFLDFYDCSKINFVTVCRISSVKGLDRTVDIFYHLKTVGLSNFTWTLVGDGPDFQELKKKINSLEMEDCIFMVGEKTNPYPYIVNSSYFLLPSRHEAAPMVFNESAILGVPIITTETCSAKEMVEERKIGLVIENNDRSLEKIIRSIVTGEINPYSVFTHPKDVNYLAKQQLEYLLEETKNSEKR